MLMRTWLREDFRAFANGPLAVCLDRFGGIDSIRLLRIMDFGGSFYPERNATDFFTRNGRIGNRPLDGPALWFGSWKPDAYVFCDTTGPEVFPEACRTRGFSMYLGCDFISAVFAVKPGFYGSLYMDPLRYRYQRGECPSSMNQCAAWHDSWLTNDQRGEDFDPRIPFEDKPVIITKNDPRFDARENALIFRIDRTYSLGEAPLFAAITASVPLVFTQPQLRWQLRSASSVRTMRFGFGFGETEQASLAAARRAVKNHAANMRFAEDRERKRFPRMCRVKLPKLPAVADFTEKFPRYQTASIVRETEEKLAVRAAQDKFGYFIMWDHIYPARDFLLMGEPEKTEKAFRFYLEYPHVASFMMVPIQLVPAINEMLAFLPDSELPGRYMDFFRRFFDFTLRWCDPETGLVANTLCLAVDFPAHVGLDGSFYEAGMNGMWYNACRVMENFAISSGDCDFAARTGETARKIEKSYARIFFHRKEGFLRTAMRADGTYPDHELFLYTNTWGLDYIHGLHLFRHLTKDLADYQVRKLRHPMGHMFTPVENGLPGRGQPACHMNQHLGHECLCSRLGGRTDEVRHVMTGYLELYEKFGNAIETFNYNYCAGDQTQRADWQTFSATAAMQALIHGAAGLHWHRGGLFHIAAEDSGRCGIGNFYFRKRRIDYSCSGRGAFVSSFSWNGRDIRGTMQIPADLMPPEGSSVKWSIRRSVQIPEFPVLLYALDAPVREFLSGDDFLSFRIDADVRAPVCFLVSGKVHLTVNDRDVSFERLSENRISIDRLFHRGDRVFLTTGKE